MEKEQVFEENIVELRENLKEVFEVNLLEGTFQFHIQGLFIEKKITNTHIGPSGTIYYVKFDEGTLFLDKFTKVKKVLTSNDEYEWCFEIYNLTGNYLGLIFKVSA